MAHDNLMNSYFNPNSVYTEEDFRCRFWMMCHVFERLLHDVQHVNLYFRQKLDRASRLGSQNDITVLGRSPLFNNQTEGKLPQLDYYINDCQYNMGYYLPDDIYPKWTTLVQAIPNPMNDAQWWFTLHQDAYRKDVEKASGILQAR
ncbi:uncharacterized protein [Malus domestica]|uniref:uncharacterized protein n=1 Tax=Malus domestica TaxID=3750 RepID=UPI0039766F61